MKKLLFLSLLPFIGIAQIQIGNDIDGEATGDFSGERISLSSDGLVLAIGSRLNDGNGNDSGHVRVYQNIGGVWTQIGDDIDGENAGDSFGDSIALSSDGTVVAIGASSNDGNGNNAGHVRVYQNTGGVWTQVGTDIDGEAVGDLSGVSVSLSSDGNVVAIGASWNDGNGNLAGHVRVYQNTGGVWAQIGDDIDGENEVDISGESVSLSSNGQVIAISARRNDGNGDDSGHVRVFQNTGNFWTQVGTDIDGENAEDNSGASVSLSSDGTIVAIGAFGNDGNGDNAGHVRIYQNTGGVWTQIGADIDGENAEDFSGGSVSLSSDGTVVAIGARSNDGNGDNSGHVRIYQNISGTWTQVGIDIDGEDSADFSGGSVSLSADGTLVAIGASSNNGNGSNSGHVRVYDLSDILSSDSFVQTNFIVYPNPTANSVTIDLNQGLLLEKVNVYSALGQLIKTEYNNVIYVNDLAKGNYFMEVFTNQGKATKTIVVE